VLGLVVAIPMVLLHTFLQGRSKRILNILQEQSAGIIAEHSEAENKSAS
jgi:biopolymer transport protein ExbB